MENRGFDMELNEKAGLLLTAPNRRSKSTDEQTPVDDEDPLAYRSRWRSIRVMHFTMLLNNISFSITISATYPLLKILDPVDGATYLGLAMAAFSIGQIFAEPIFGIWSNVRAKTREPMIVSLVITAGAFIMYTYLESFHIHAAYFLILARFLIGFGGGNIAVLRSYVAGATTLEERTAAISNVSAFQAMGLIIGPLVQTAAVPIGFPGPVQSQLFHLDMYTAIGFFGAFAAIINIILLIFVFKEHRIDDGLMSKSIIEDQAEVPVMQEYDYKLDYPAVIAPMGFYFTSSLVFVAVETISTPLSMHMFSWTKAEATLYVGIVFGAWGAVALVVCYSVQFLSKRFNERRILLAGFIICFMGYFTYLPWGNKLPDIYPAGTTGVLNSTNERYNWTDPLGAYEFPRIINTSVSLGTEQPRSVTERTTSVVYTKRGHTSTAKAIGTLGKHTNVSNDTMSSAATTVNNTMSVAAIETDVTTKTGCPRTYDWCFYTPAVRLWQFCAGTLCLACGFPLCHVISCTLFSKMLGPKPQGTWTGVLTGAGSLARLLGPEFVSHLYQAFGPRIPFTSILALILLTIFGLVLVYRRLVPYGTLKNGH